MTATERGRAKPPIFASHGFGGLATAVWLGSCDTWEGWLLLWDPAGESDTCQGWLLLWGPAAVRDTYEGVMVPRGGGRAESTVFGERRILALGGAPHSV